MGIVGVGEIGIFHSMGLDEQKTMVRRLDPEHPETRAKGNLKWELGNLGLKGGEVIAVGTPEQVATVEESHTGQFLREVLAEPAAAAA